MNIQQRNYLWSSLSPNLVKNRKPDQAKDARTEMTAKSSETDATVKEKKY